MIILVKLILAHLIGDFILQPNRWISDKETHRWGSGKLYLHCLVHFLLILLVVWDLSFWYVALGISLSHGLIDFLKVSLQSKHTRRLWFFVDQSLHFSILITAWLYWTQIPLKLHQNDLDALFIYVTAIIALTIPASVLIKTIISKWTPFTEDSENESLKNAGKYIGMLERLFVFAFIIAGRWEAVGFLIAAKSVFRFGDLRESRSRKLTEYILIGTLMSFGLAVLTGLIVHFLVAWI